MNIKNISVEELESRVNDLIDNATPSEIAFKKRLDKLRIKYHFQWAIETKLSYFIADFFIPKYKLIFEIDGYYHFTNKGKARDKIRDSVLSSMGYRVIHIPNNKVETYEIKLKNDKKKVLRCKAKLSSLKIQEKRLLEVERKKKAQEKARKIMKLKYPHIF